MRIDTGRFLVSDGAQVLAGTFGAGNGGSLLITAADSVEVIGRSADGQIPSGLSAQSSRSGDAQIPSGLSAQSSGSGDAGDLTIDTGRLLVRDGAVVSTGSYRSGKGGSLQISASDSVEVIGRSADNRFGSSLSATTQRRGDAGELRINTGRLLVSDGAQVSAGTFGAGNGGSLQINASDSVEVIGTSAGNRAVSGLFSASVGSGDAGDLTIDTGRLLVRDGSQVSASTGGEGKGGNLLIMASDSVELIGSSTDANGRPFPSGLFAQSEESGDAGDLTIDTGRLLVKGGAQVFSGTRGLGNGGRLLVRTTDSVELIGSSLADGGLSTGLSAQSEGSGDAGDLRIDTRRLLVQGGASITVSTLDSGKGGNLQINASDSVEVIGTSADGQSSSRLSAQSDPGSGDAGNLTIDTRRLLVGDGAQVSAGTIGSGNGGSLLITASDSVELFGIGTSAVGVFPSGLFTESDGSGNAGKLSLDTRRLLVRDGAQVSSRSLGTGTAGNINITARDTLQADNGTIATDSTQNQGGGITISAGNIRLFGNSDIISNVASGAGGGGNIDLKAGSIVAFDDSDILAYARDGQGGNITLNTRAFFGENYRPAPKGTDPRTLDRNNRVDVNASGAEEGVVTRPDTTFIQNSLTELPDNQINTDQLLANSCIVRRNQPTRGSFTITGSGGLPQRPGDAQRSTFPTVDIETLPSDSTPTTTNPKRPWQKGDPIVEPQGVYRLPNGKLVLSRECSRIQ
jgi:large exoprotein involved in heme utilization and adhesion